MRRRPLRVRIGTSGDHQCCLDGRYGREVNPPRKPTIHVRDRLSPSEVASIEHLVVAAAGVDKVRALDEQATLRLHHSVAPANDAERRADGRADDVPATTHLLAMQDDEIRGYAYLDRPDPEGDASAGVVVHPDHRGHGLGATLVGTLLTKADGAPVRIWAHGPHPAAARLADAYGFVPIRELAWMRRPLTGPEAAPLPDVPPPVDVTIRTFRRGQDEDAWLAANAEAFASHPEQGRWTRADLEARLAAPWFDPAGFFVADDPRQPGRLLGFHWTKVHEGETRGGEPGPVGEIYVLGVVPRAQGTGLAKALAVVGLQYLRQRGLGTVMLYVEADNPAALRLYQKLGFTHAATDVMYRHPGSTRA